MSGTLNKVTLIGHLGDEVKVRYFEGGNAIGRFPLATHDIYTNKSGERIKSTEWHNIVVKNQLAELCETYLVKGDKIYCEGKLRTRHYQKDGVTHSITEVIVREVIFLTNKKQEQKP